MRIIWQLGGFWVKIMQTIDIVQRSTLNDRVCLSTQNVCQPLAIAYRITAQCTVSKQIAVKLRYTFHIETVRDLGFYINDLPVFCNVA